MYTVNLSGWLAVKMQDGKRRFTLKGRIWSRNFEGRGVCTYVLISGPGDSDAAQSLRPSDL